MTRQIKQEPAKGGVGIPITAQPDTTKNTMIVASTVQADSREEAEANAALIVQAVNFHDQLVDALKAISTHWANQYDHPNMEAPMYQGPYGTGVTDGHRACKAIADNYNDRTLRFGASPNVYGSLFSISWSCPSRSALGGGCS
jgi:hypothetical protein